MSNDLGHLHAEFPRAVRGYSSYAVDDFVRQIGARLEKMQYQLDEQTTRADRLQAELEFANRNLAAFIEKESAIAQGIVATEQHRVRVEQEMELAQLNARLESDSLVEEARRQASGLLDEARREAEERITEIESACSSREEEARARCAELESRLSALRAEYDAAVARIRQFMEEQFAHLPITGTAITGTRDESAPLLSMETASETLAEVA